MAEILTDLPADLRRLVAGTARLGIGFDDRESVVETAVRKFFQARDSLREAAAVERYCSCWMLTTKDVAVLADVHPGEEVEELLRAYGVLGEIEGGPFDTDDKTDVESIAELPTELTQLVQGVVNLSVGFESERAVVAASLRRFFRGRETIRAGATANCYAERDLSLAEAATLAQVPLVAVPELLRDHGVDPGTIDPVDVRRDAERTVSSVGSAPDKPAE